MSDALATEYGCRAPVVLYNAFQWSDRQSLDGLFKDRIDRKVPSVHWYSQTLGPGRGLEDLVSALQYLRRDVEIHLRGKPAPGYLESLLASVPVSLRERIVVHELVSNAQLLSRIAEHDVGFAGEVPFCRSRNLTVTNKILHYLLGGLAVIASDTAGQGEIAKQAAGAIQLYPSGNPPILAQRLSEWLLAPERLASAKAAALRAAAESYSWERQEPTLLRSVEAALARTPPHAVENRR